MELLTIDLIRYAIWNVHRAFLRLQILANFPNMQTKEKRYVMYCQVPDNRTHVTFWYTLFKMVMVSHDRGELEQATH